MQIRNSRVVANGQKKDWKIATHFAFFIPIEKFEHLFNCFIMESTQLKTLFYLKWFQLKKTYSGVGNNPRITTKFVFSQITILVTNKYW